MKRDNILLAAIIFFALQIATLAAIIIINADARQRAGDTLFEKGPCGECIAENGE
ncbi:hypothetical protein [Hyphococcus sp.]|uniref:hypothetical protein n=1 Tax=Hyphococcus sp. TaxID=2038636 RepID=UPI00208A1962|nr:MAG: hypothetical protein DHS20C04_28160 [Marinicaulis sp.]